MSVESAPVGDLEGLELVLTARCNLRCSYCFQNDKNPRRMEWETMRGALDLLLASRAPKKTVVFLGGEPLLEFPLLQRGVEHLRRHVRGSQEFALELITNGTLLGEAEVDFLVENDFNVQLSFDGAPAAQALRGPRTFAHLDALLGRLRRKRPDFLTERLQVSLTLSAATVPYLAESVRYFLRRGVGTFSISPLFTHDPDWKRESIALLESQMEEVLRLSIRHYRRTGTVPFTHFRKQADEGGRHAPQGEATCGAPTGQVLAVDVDGRTSGCVLFLDSYQKFPTPFLGETANRLQMGDYREDGFAERLAEYPAAARGTRLFHGKAGKRSSYGACADCRFLDDCAICPASIAHIPGNSDPDRIPDFPCAWNLVALAARERFPAQPNPLEIFLGTARAYGPAGRAQRRLLAAMGESGSRGART